MITKEFIEKIERDINLHMLIKNTAGLATALMKTQEDIEEIKKHLGIGKEKQNQDSE